MRRARIHHQAAGTAADATPAPQRMRYAPPAGAGADAWWCTVGLVYSSPPKKKKKRRRARPWPAAARERGIGGSAHPRPFAARARHPPGFCRCWPRRPGSGGSSRACRWTRTPARTPSRTLTARPVTRLARPWTRPSRPGGPGLERRRRPEATARGFGARSSAPRDGGERLASSAIAGPRAKENGGNVLSSLR